MFGFFRKARPKLHVSEKDKEWLDQCIRFFYGSIDPPRKTFYYPTREDFSLHTFKDEAALRQLVLLLCEQLQVELPEFEVRLFERVGSSKRQGIQPEGKFYEIHARTEWEKEKPVFHIVNVLLALPELVVSALVSEILRIKFGNEQWYKELPTDYEKAVFIELLKQYHGYGIFAANAHTATLNGLVKRSRILTPERISYVNALLCVLNDIERKGIEQHLGDTTYLSFCAHYEYLKNMDPPDFTTQEAENKRVEYKEQSELYKLLRERSFEQLETLGQQLLEKRPDDFFVAHNLAYAWLLQKKYKESIDLFLSIIERRPDNEYTYKSLGYAHNNIGYARLQLGLLEEGLEYINKAHEMDKENAFVYRNKGVYNLYKNKLDKAESYFAKAYRMDAATELIFFYQGQVALRQNNTERAKELFRKSKERNECNDSVLAYPADLA